tara:strand:+ start:809 stop:970 length:162 start_codon:yes stop_codon:yes gene_type:complete
MWHDAQRVERDRYAGLLAAGVTDAARTACASACSACGGGEGDARGASGLVGGP